jgi:DNA repair protein RecO (recombination protein O)
MEIQKASGIVLSSRQFGESDFLCTIYTKEFGKRDFIFKGLQKSKKRPQIVSEPGTVGDIVYYFHDDKTSYIVNEYNIIKHNISIRNDLKKIYLLYFVLALIEKTTGYNDKNKSLFDLITAGIDNIPDAEFHEHFSVFFILHLLRLHGILPDFQRCKICNKSDSSGFYIDTLDFHPVCGNCVSSIKNKILPVNKLTREFIAQSMKNKFSLIDHSGFPSKNILDLLFSITLFIESYYHVEIKPKSLLISELSRQS